MGPYEVTKGFEQELCRYTGARYAVAVNSGTAAIMLACEWFRPKDSAEYLKLEITLPARTYCSAPQAVKRAGFRTIKFVDYGWTGFYQLAPLPVHDSATRFTSGMYRAGQFQCVSFAARKILGAEQGGAILHDNEEADAWFRRMRFDGRTEGVDPKDDTFDLIGHHCLMIPSVAATLLLRLYHLPQHNEDIGGSDDYPDISGHPAFK